MFLCQSHLNDFVNYMSTKYSNIKFTSEYEMNNSFSFLDVKITRTNNQLVTSVFRKATFSGVFTNFKSVMPAAYKFCLDTLYFMVYFPFVPHMKNFMKKYCY